MALKISGATQPPEFSLLEYIARAIEDCISAGRSPLHKFTLDLTHEKVPGIWRPSSLRRCMRAQVYKATKTPHSDAPFDPQRQHNFDRGHLFGAWFAAYVLLLEDCYGFKVIETEVILHDADTEIGGKADIILEKDGHKYVVEVKSKENAAVMANIKPSPTDLAQLNDYQKMCGAKAGWLVYFGVDVVSGKGRTARTGIRAKEFFHRLDTAIWADSEKKVQMLSWFLRDQTKLAPKTANQFFECGGCYWKTTCEQELPPELVKLK